MKGNFLSWVFAAVLLVGCSAPARTQFPAQTKPFLPTGITPQDLPTAVHTLAPAETAYPATTLAYPSDAPYPVPPQTDPDYPAPQLLPAASPTFQVTAAPAGPFHDCARTPGLVGCSSDAVALKARLAYVDSSPARLVSLDLENGQGWQANLPAGASPNALQWSPDGPDGPRLLVSLGADRYQIRSAEGAVLGEVSSQAPLTWQPDADLNKDGAIHSENGEQAFLEHTPDLRWLLHVKTAQDERVLPLDSNPGDIFYGLLGWMPGSQMLLAQSYFAGNQAMTQGGQIISIDAGNGAIQSYPARLPLSDFPAAYFAWDPTRPTRMAFLESGETSVLAPRLALLDFQTGKLQFPLPEGLLLSNLAWNPDGRLAFAVSRTDGLASTTAMKDFPAPGIYLLEPHNGQTHALVSTPPGATDTWPNWTAEGKTLVYARALTGQNGASLVQVRARRIEDGAEWLLVEGLPVTGTAGEPNFAVPWLAFSVK